MLRSTVGDEIAVEWEWGGVWGNELDKLRSHKVRGKDKNVLKYAVLITYTHTPNIERVYLHVMEKWERAPWPLLLILIDLEESNEFYFHKRFKSLNISVFDKNTRKELRAVPALPWEVSCTRWSTDHVGLWK